MVVANTGDKDARPDWNMAPKGIGFSVRNVVSEN
jgi:hypothetical protein